MDYYTKGEAYTYVDDDTWQEASGADLTNPFIIDNVKSLTDIAGRKVAFTYTGKGLMGRMVDGAGGAQPKVFGFRYDATQGNRNVKLVKVTDPRRATPRRPSMTGTGWRSRRPTRRATGRR